MNQSTTNLFASNDFYADRSAAFICRIRCRIMDVVESQRAGHRRAGIRSSYSEYRLLGNSPQQHRRSLAPHRTPQGPNQSSRSNSCPLKMSKVISHMNATGSGDTEADKF
jgi:hypothetical protein